jgi:hypothetical protein
MQPLERWWRGVGIRRGVGRCWVWVHRVRESTRMI